MKTINVSSEDNEMKAIEKAKKGQSWRKFILERAAIDSSNEIHSKGINADALRGLCLEYDWEYGEYPESRYEGHSLLHFFLEDIIKVKTEPLINENEVWHEEIRELGGGKEGEKNMNCPDCERPMDKSMDKKGEDTGLDPAMLF